MESHVEAGAQRPAADDDGSVASDAATMAGWTLVSRVTGLVRLLALGAVLGQTYFANLVTTSMLLPTMIYELVVGHFLTSLFVPPLVARLDREDREGTDRLASSFLGLTGVVFGLVGLVVALAGPLVLRLFLTGVDDAAIHETQLFLGWPMLAVLAPAAGIYGMIATATAVQFAHHKFALTSAAPAIENVGIIATIVLSGVIYGTGRELDDVGLAHAMFIACGVSLSIAVHGIVQWVGVRSLGLRFLPRTDWRDPDIRDVAQRAVASLGGAALSGARSLGMVVAAGSVAGGVVAIQLALAFANTIIALTAKPVAASLLPRLSRLVHAKDEDGFRIVLRDGQALFFFLAFPAAAMLAILAQPIAEMVARGELATDLGISMVAAATLGISLFVIAEGGFQVSTGASYSRLDVKSPLMAMVAGTIVAYAGFAYIVFRLESEVAVLLASAVTLSCSTLVSAAMLESKLVRSLPRGPRNTGPLLAFLGAAAASATAVGALALLGPDTTALIRLSGAGVGATSVYLGLGFLMRSPQLAELKNLRGSTVAVDT